jgi:hypothetical protein
MRKGGMQRGSSENQGERWHTKSRRKTEIKETGVGVEKRMENLFMWRFYIIR